MYQHSMSTRFAAVLAAGAIGATLTLAGCSNGGKKGANGGGNNVSSSGNPQQAVAGALKNLGSQSNVELSVSLGVSQAQAEQLKDSKGAAPTPAEAQALSTGSIFFTIATGHGEAIDSQQAQSDPQEAIDFGLTIGSDTPLELRYVGQNLYVRAQIQKLLSDVGQNPSKASNLSAQASQINAFVPGVNSLIQGNWVEVSHASLESLGAQFKQFASSAAGTSTATTLSPTALKANLDKMRKQVLSAIQANATFASLGNNGGRNEYSATINVSSLVSALVPVLQNFYSGIPVVGSKAGSSLSQLQSSIPKGQTAVLDLFVAGNKLSEADLDLNQFNHTFGQAVPLKMAFSSPGAPSAPSGATNLDLSKLPSLLGSMLGGLGKSSSTSG